MTGERRRRSPNRVDKSCQTSRPPLLHHRKNYCSEHLDQADLVVTDPAIICLHARSEIKLRGLLAATDRGHPPAIRGQSLL